MKRHVYTGQRKDDYTTQVFVDMNMLLNPRLDIRRHSTTGFEWAYAGSGPAQLAIALLAHHAGKEVAEQHYHRFNNEVIASLPKKGWTIASADIELWLKLHA